MAARHFRRAQQQASQAPRHARAHRQEPFPADARTRRSVPDASPAASPERAQARTAASTDTGSPARRQPSVARELIGLLIKLGVIAVAVWAIFTFVFGLVRVSDPSMSPNIKDGDLVLIDRLDHDFVASDIVAFTYRDRLTFARVVATAGDEVDIHDDALYVNGSYQQETWAQGVTTRFEGGVDLPLTVPEGSVFVLGDNRTNASDSRIIGTLDAADTNGTVIGIFRRRNL